MLRKGLTLFVAVLFLTPALAAQELKKQFWEAARKGDAETITALLEKGVDVNTPFRYSATALSFACDRGHVEVVKVLLEHGADVNVKDSFYGATPLTWALSPPSDPPDREKHNQVVDLLLSKGAGGEQGPENVLQRGVSMGDAELVRVALSHRPIPDTVMTAMLTAAAENGREKIAALLRAAGAKPLEETRVDLSVETLQRFAGRYRDGRSYHWRIELRERRLYAQYERGGGPGVELLALSETSFRPRGSALNRFEFQTEKGKVTGFTLRQGQREQFCIRVEDVP